MERTHNCAALNTEHLDKEAALCGWVNGWRDHGGVIFIDLRDRSGLVQVVFNPEDNKDLHQQARDLRSEFVLQVIELFEEVGSGWVSIVEGPDEVVNCRAERHERFRKGVSLFFEAYLLPGGVSLFCQIFIDRSGRDKVVESNVSP